MSELTSLVASFEKGVAVAAAEMEEAAKASPGWSLPLSLDSAKFVPQVKAAPQVRPKAVSGELPPGEAPEAAGASDEGERRLQLATQSREARLGRPRVSIVEGEQGDPPQPLSV